MDSVIVLDFGGQYAHLITRRIRDLGVYSEILPYDVDVEILIKKNPKAIILSGGPGSIYKQDSPRLNKKFFQYIKEEQIPVLGICYGHHLIIDALGGKVQPKEKKEYGRTKLLILIKKLIFDSLDKEEIDEKFESIEKQALELIKKDGFKEGEIIQKRFLDIQYKGQSYFLTVPYPSDLQRPHPQIRKDFNALHNRHYGFAVENKTLILVNVRSRVIGSLVPPKFPQLEK